MSASEYLSDPICWHEGMLLSPQHFQQDHLYWEQRILRYLSNQAPYFWGVQQLVYDEGALSEGRLVVRRLACAMPDGMLIDYDSRKSDDLLNLSFKDSVPLNQTRRIYLSVPVHFDGAASDKTDNRRYRSYQAVPQVDDNTNEGSVVLQRLRPIISLSIGDEPGGQYVSLPLLEVKRLDNASFDLTDYCPPATDLRGCKFLGNYSPLQKATDLAMDIRKRVRRLEGIVGDGGEKLGASASERQRQWILALVKPLPELEVLLDSAVVPPFDLYRTLARAMGQLSELGSEPLPPKLPAYQHKDTAQGFKMAFEFLTGTIKEISLSYTTLTFAEEQYGIFSLPFDKAWKGRKVYLEIRPTPNVNMEQAEAWMNAGCVASFSKQRELKLQRMSGAEVFRVPADKDGDIQARSGNLLFKVEDSPNILPGQKLIIRLMDMNLDSMRPERIFLHVPHAVPVED